MFDISYYFGKFKDIKRFLRICHNNVFYLLVRLRIIKGIVIKCGPAGFFGELFNTLNGIRFAEQQEISAKVVWGKESSYYSHSLKGNVWSHIFKNYIFNFGSRRFGLIVKYRPLTFNFAEYEGLSTRESIGFAVNRWCIANDNISSRVNTAIANFVDVEFVLGVHVRSTDAAAGFENRKTVSVDDFIKAIHERVFPYKEYKIFLATDDARVLSKINLAFPGCLIFQDCIRSYDGRSIHGHLDGGTFGDPLKKAEDVFIDACILASCDYLLMTKSRVTTFALCLNSSLQFDDLSSNIESCHF